jgi:ABC-type dipeptide/oligopeptide/nickel transport system ATPase component
LGIVGESGSGKSTLALTILRILPPAARIVSGKMLFEGEDLLEKSDTEMRHVRGKRIAMILQDPMASLNPLFTIGDQVGEPIRVHDGASRSTAWSRAKDLLKAVRIPSPETRVTQYPHEMSGGMRQRIVGAIGISCEPRLLIADEPTTSLDLTIQAQYLNLLRDLQCSGSTTSRLSSSPTISASSPRCATSWRSCMPGVSSRPDRSRRSSIRPPTPTPRRCSTRSRA